MSLISTGKVAAPDEAQDLRGMFTLSRDLLVDWTGTGRGFHVDFEDGEAVPLPKGRVLGRGSSVDVYETTVQGVNLAWKSIRLGYTRKEHFEKSSLRAEVRILKKVSHIHIVQLVGSYASRPEIGLLLYPVAVYNLRNFLFDLEHQHASDEINASLETRGFLRDSHTRSKATLAVSRIGCITSAVAYLHRSGIRHNDLNPSHILLSPGGVWLTGFGNATDSSTETDSSTDAWRQTRKYSAPEVAELRFRGRAADIFSLGCVFLEILVLHHTGSQLRFPSTSSSSAFQANLDILDYWLTGLDETALLEEAIHQMLSAEPEMRPTADDLLLKFSTFETTVSEKIAVFNSCCRPSLPSYEQRSLQLESSYAKDREVLMDIKSQPSTSIVDAAENSAELYTWRHATTDDPTYTQTSEVIDLYQTDALPRYSKGSNVEDVDWDHVKVFVSKLIQEVTMKDSTADISNIWQDDLRNILRTFAGRLHEESTKPFQWQVSATLYERVDTVIDILTDIYKAQINADTANEKLVKHGQPPHPSSQSHDEMAIWISEVEPSPHSWAQEGSVYPPGKTTSPSMQTGDAFICQSTAYRWLLSCIRERSQTSRIATKARDAIGEDILQALITNCTRKMSKEGSMPECSIVFKVFWSPRGYIEDLGLLSALPPESICDHIMCLTGTLYAAQAMTVSDYVHQTWPVTGHRILSLLAELISGNVGQESSYIDLKTVGVQFTAEVKYPGWYYITATGGPFHVSEAAEQVAWLTATLRPSHASDNVTLVTPSIETLKVLRPYKELPEIQGTCRIVINSQQGSGSIIDTHGTCWTKLFSRAVLVGGYPIIHRVTTTPGLQTSLKIMASLARSSQVVRYDDRIVIKGFSSLLIVKRLVNNTFLWHAHQSEVEEERISFFDPQVVTTGEGREQLPPLRALENAVHIVGWCSKATDFCGNRTAYYDVTGSSVSQTPASTYIDRLYIEAGMYCIGGITMRPNQHEKPTKLIRHTDYFQYLDWVSKQPVAFYDTCDHRAWLIDGASALLHLARISLYKDQNDPERSFHWTYENDKLKDTWPGCPGRLAAKKSLMDWDNLSLPVYQSAQCLREGKTVKEFSTFQDRVFGILLRLETLIDCLIYLASKDGFAITQTMDKSKGLIGFDVFDIIAPDGPVKSRTAPFQIYGDGWVDLLPAIKTLTIFGQNFGELIRPNNPDSICTQWRSIPKGQNYLVSTVSTLKKLHEVQGWRQATLSNSDQLTSTLSWKSPTRPFEPCKCISDSNICEHIDPVQYVVSESSLRNRNLKNASPVDLHTLDSEGAVVFANLTLSGKKAPMVKQKVTQAQASNVNLAPSNSGSGSLSTSASLTAGSSTVQSAASTNTTQSTASPMSSNAQGGVIREESRLKKWKEKVVERLKR
ncbi:hypothetical protein FB567DRAFT_629366 [Paraphoma chrysanthemicola]|uniref:Protein kinase domain-containing protein n=1 Tax=Paraphoma chrysanthemicola TaxID=798071 RepID=A0A8K0VX50_9PLEO|nr:hypothetical protein FB567DRAFT_629366 [Paraphoma chrysanthemicola]